MDGYDLLTCLEAIDPGALSYQDWTLVGMALKEAGYGPEVWDEWSRRDASRYHAGECLRKWQTFQGSGNPVTGGTIVQLAREHGWRSDEGHELAWDEELSLRPSALAVDPGWLEAETIQEPTGKGWDPVSELSRYLELLFDRDDHVGYVTECWQKEDGGFAPRQGSYDRTAGELLDKLGRCKGDIGKVIGDPNPSAGAWIRFNPLDGHGVKNANVTEFRYALVECDNVEKDKQLPLYKQLNLPIAVVVDSGNKSVHAIVKIMAGSELEYKRRVEYLYKVLRERGVEVDTQNKNASRLSRMPGVMRAGRKQFIIEEASGAEDWEAWREWIKAQEDDLPDVESLADVDAPPLAPPVIAGILRKGHKLMLAGPSKAGKSFALLELAMSIAGGHTWMGWRCTRGKVLYVNMELARESCLQRLKLMQEQYGLSEDALANVRIWNLRGKAVTLKELVPKLIRRLRDNPVDVIILDPIYKLIGGNESDMGDVARFCALLDRLCVELGCAVVYCHHHSKGAQAGKNAADRASGSGVFARDADALLDMIQLRVPESMQSFCGVGETATAWRIEPVLREFPEPGPIEVWFDYPLHFPDQSGQLATCKPDTGTWTPEEMQDRKSEELDKRIASAVTAYNNARGSYPHGQVPLKVICTVVGVKPRTVASYFDKLGGYAIVGDRQKDTEECTATVAMLAE